MIVDYKTDRVFSGDGRELAEKYGRQLELYGKALEQISGKTVKEMVIYSLTLGARSRFREWGCIEPEKQATLRIDRKQESERSVACSMSKKRKKHRSAGTDPGGNP